MKASVTKDVHPRGGSVAAARSPRTPNISPTSQVTNRRQRRCRSSASSARAKAADASMLKSPPRQPSPASPPPRSGADRPRRHDIGARSGGRLFGGAVDVIGAALRTTQILATKSRTRLQLYMAKRRFRRPLPTGKHKALGGEESPKTTPAFFSPPLPPLL
jgi:hypothetical protein